MKVSLEVVEKSRMCSEWGSRLGEATEIQAARSSHPSPAKELHGPGQVTSDLVLCFFVDAI